MLRSTGAVFCQHACALVPAPACHGDRSPSPDSIPAAAHRLVSRPAARQLRRRHPCACKPACAEGALCCSAAATAAAVYHTPCQQATTHQPAVRFCCHSSARCRTTRPSRQVACPFAEGNVKMLRLPTQQHRPLSTKHWRISGLVQPSACPSATLTDEPAQRAALGQQMVTAAMRVLLIALATALVLRTGVVQFFSSALLGAARGGAGGGTAGAGAAVAAAFLVPGLQRKLASPAAQRMLGERCCATTAICNARPRDTLGGQQRRQTAISNLRTSKAPWHLLQLHLLAGVAASARDHAAQDRAEYYPHMNTVQLVCLCRPAAHQTGCAGRHVCRGHRGGGRQRPPAGEERGCAGGRHQRGRAGARVGVAAVQDGL